MADQPFRLKEEEWALPLPFFEKFRPWDASTWEWWQYLCWVGFVCGGLEVVSWLLDVIPRLFNPKQLRARGKHLDHFGSTDKIYIAINKFSTAFFSYHVLRFSWYSANVTWDLGELNAVNTFVAIGGLYAVYDFCYFWFHRILHMRFIYRFIHKHHHNQHVPTRGNADAALFMRDCHEERIRARRIPDPQDGNVIVNVHPFEFLGGEYLHLIAMFFIPCHVTTAVVFIMMGGVMASLNHTRHDLSVPGFWEVAAHDQHHVVPTCNYSQYTMLWDRVFGTYQQHPDIGKLKVMS